MVGLGEPQLHAKFEVASFSRCTTIKENPKNLGSSYSTGQRLFFSSAWDFMMGLGKPKCVPNLKSLASAVV